MDRTLEAVIREVEKAVTGKRETIRRILMALLAGGHILLDDVPGVGKTTLAVALGRALGLETRRIQFTPDVLPSDIVGFSVLDRETETPRYVRGVVLDANLLLGDEINRASSRTQSALLEAMEERQVTVDGVIHPLKTPFCVIATQNRVGTAGTQPLPHAQMDRFLVRLTPGYPDFESEMAVIRDRRTADPLEQVARVAARDDVLRMQEAVRAVTMKEELIAYIVRLAEASRSDPRLALGISPRGALSLGRMARACAYLNGRDYAVPEDVRAVFSDVCAHRVLPGQRARLDGAAVDAVLAELLETVPLPHALNR